MQNASYTLLIGLAPAPSTLVDAVQEIDVDSSLEEASVFRIRFGITQTSIGDWSVLDVDAFKPFVPIQIRVQRGSGPLETLINGFVTEHRVAYAGGPGSRTLEVTGMDATMLMNLQETVQPWPNLPDSAIATAIFGQHSLIPIVEPTSPVLVEPDGTTMQRGTDIRFLRGLARRNGFDCYVQPEPLTGLDQGFFRARKLLGLPQAVLSVSFGTETNVQDFSVRYELAKPTAAAAVGLDVPTKSLQPVYAPAAVEAPLGQEPTLLREVPLPFADAVEPELPRSAELGRAVQALVDRSSWAVVAEGAVGLDVPVLRPGGIVNIRGLGRLYNGSYYVTRVRHTIAPGRYEQRFEAQRNAVGETGAEIYVAVP